jgi:hypothetical protein
MRGQRRGGCAAVAGVLCRFGEVPEALRLFMVLHCGELEMKDSPVKKVLACLATAAGYYPMGTPGW